MDKKKSVTGEWIENQQTLDLWGFKYIVNKRRGKKAPEGSEASVVGAYYR